MHKRLRGEPDRTESAKFTFYCSTVKGEPTDPVTVGGVTEPVSVSMFFTKINDATLKGKKYICPVAGAGETSLQVDDPALCAAEVAKMPNAGALKCEKNHNVEFRAEKHDDKDNA